MARIIAHRKAREEEALEVELSINAHFALDDECDHHCSDCCIGLYMEEQGS